MSRQNPIGFGLSMLIEIAAIVAIVSVLPKFDLRPTTTAAADESLPSVEGSVLPVGWTDPAQRNEIAAQPTSYYERRAAAPIAPAAPPLIERDANRPQYVEQRLDRHSQQLVNGVGTAVADAADKWLRNPPPPLTPRAAQLPVPMHQQSQMRPWIRY